MKKVFKHLAAPTFLILGATAVFSSAAVAQEKDKEKDKDQELPVLNLRELRTVYPDEERMKRLLQQAMGNPTYRIGVQCRPMTKDSEGEDEGGVVVEAVGEDTPAAKIGIQGEDRLTKMNGEPLKSVEQLMKGVQTAGKEDKELELEVVRGEETLTLKVKPAKIEVSVQLDDLDGMTFPSHPPFGWVMPGNGAQGWIVGRPMPQGGGSLPGNIAIPPQFGVIASQDELKKEIEELRKEIAELKEMIRELKKKD